MNLSAPASNHISLALASLASGRKGLTPAFGETLAEAACVCFEERGHSSPTPMNISGSYSLSAGVDWSAPSEQAKRCWNDDEVTTEQGAYGIAVLLVECCGLEVIERSKKKTGFDYWLGDPSSSNTLFQGLSRLEVSGIRNGDNSSINSRVKQKLKQTEVSDGMLPAVIVVVEFGTPTARLEERCKT
jgi:hypothetical protein